MREPKAGDGERHRRVRAGRGEAGEEGAVERPLARAEVAGDESAGPRAARQPCVLEKPAMLDPRRFGRGRDRAAHPGGRELLVAGVPTGPAGGALEPRGESFRVGEQGDALRADRHLADRNRPTPVGGLA